MKNMIFNYGLAVTMALSSVEALAQIPTAETAPRKSLLSRLKKKNPVIEDNTYFQLKADVPAVSFEALEAGLSSVDPEFAKQLSSYLTEQYRFYRSVAHEPAEMEHLQPFAQGDKSWNTCLKMGSYGMALSIANAAQDTTKIIWICDKKYPDMITDIQVITNRAVGDSTSVVTRDDYAIDPRAEAKTLRYYNVSQDMRITRGNAFASAFHSRDADGHQQYSAVLQSDLFSSRLTYEEFATNGDAIRQPIAVVHSPGAEMLNNSYQQQCERFKEQFSAVFHHPAARQAIESFIAVHKKTSMAGGMK